MYKQTLVQTIRAGHYSVSECAEGVSLDKRLKICSVWRDDTPYAPYELREWSHMAASPRHIFLGNAEGVVKMYARAAPQQAPVTIDTNNPMMAVSHLALSRDARHLLILQQHKHAYTYAIDTATLHQLPPILSQIPLNPLAYIILRKHVTGCWAPNNSDVLIVYNSQPLLYRGNTRSWQEDILTHNAGTQDGSIVVLPLCAWSPRGDTFVLVGVGQVFCVWLYLYRVAAAATTTRLQLTILFATTRQASLTALEYSADGSLLVVATRLHPFIHFFSPATGAFLFSLQFPLPQTVATTRWDWVTHVQMSVAECGSEQIHVAYKNTYYIHQLMPRWKETMLQVMMLSKRRRLLPPELWHMISWDFRDALILSHTTSPLSPVVIHNSTFF